MDGLKQALYEAALMHHHRICVIQSMVGTPNASIQEKYEMSGSITHTPPNSIVHCLCPKVEPQTYKSKVWEGGGGVRDDVISAGEPFSHTPSWPGNSY